MYAFIICILTQKRYMTQMFFNPGRFFSNVFTKHVYSFDGEIQDYMGIINDTNATYR